MGVAHPGVQEADVLLLVFQTNEEEEVTDFITYTQHKVENVRLVLLHQYIGGIETPTTTLLTSLSLIR
jgi:metal-responsive CopG/Arc/MetJ family transcriptional regulator